MIGTLLLAVIVGLILYHWIIHKGRMGKLVDKFPGPPALPILGNLLKFQLSGEQLWNISRTLSDEFYPRFRLWSGSIPIINLRHPDDAEALLTSTKHIEKSLIYNFLHPWFRTGLLTSTGSKWQTRRKILTPAFHFNILKQFVDVFVEESERLCTSLQKEEGPVVKDLRTLVSEHTLNAICETAMGTSLVGRDQTFQEEYREAVRKMGEVIIYRIVRPWLQNAYVFMLTQQGKLQKVILKILHDFTNKIIQERKVYHKETSGRYLRGWTENDEKNAESNVDVHQPKTKKKRLAMLDLLIAAQEDGFQIDDLDIREEVDTFMFEGHDTTAVGIMFCLMLLAENKEIQDRARAEIDSALEESEGKLNTSVLQRLTYLERCLKETLRLYPSVPLISRKIAEDLVLKSHIVPAGAICHLHIYDLQRDPNFWTNPNKFDPDRFLPENSYGRHPFSYVPFSAGPRNCIGQKFAMLEMKALVGYVLHNFHLEPVDPLNQVRFIADLVIRTRQPLRVRFVPIKN